MSSEAGATAPAFHEGRRRALKRAAAVLLAAVAAAGWWLVFTRLERFANWAVYGLFQAEAGSRLGCASALITRARPWYFLAVRSSIGYLAV